MLNDKICVPYICQEACTLRGALVASQALQTHRPYGLIRPGFRHTWQSRVVCAFRKIHVGGGKLAAQHGSALDQSDITTVANNVLNVLFKKYIVTLNRVYVSPSKGLCNYRWYIESLLKYGQHASQSSQQRFLTF